MYRQDIRQIPVRLQMLLSGQIESALLPEPLVSLVEAKGARTILNDCKLYTPLAVIALKRDVLDAPDGAQTVAIFREALREAAKCINETPDAYRPIMEAKGLLPKGASANYTMVRFDMTHTPTGLPSEADIKTFADWMKANRILKKDPAYGDVVFQ
jgi:ABC-type nitrate/sulfonate/bicarbonate transport systems, periplasmic components